MIGSRVTRAVLGLDLKLLVRDTRTLLMAVVLPVVILPIFLLLSQRSQEQAGDRAEGRQYRAAWVGDVPQILEGWPEESGIQRIDWRRMEDPEAAAQAIELRELEFWVQVELSSDEDAQGEPVVRIHYRGDREASNAAVSMLTRALREHREAIQRDLLTEAGFPVPMGEILPLQTLNAAPEEQVAGARLGLFLTPLLLLLVAVGGSVLALDGIAGEKERGTLLTLMASGAPRRDVILGKLGAVVLVGVAIGAVQILNLWLMQTVLGDARIAGIEVSIAPDLAVLLLLLYLPAVVLVGGLLLLSSAWSRSYKEAQLLFTPVLLLLLVPSLASLLPDLSPRSILVLVPLANLSVGVRDLLAGQGDLPALTATWGVNALAAVWVLRATVRTLEDEGRLTSDLSRAEFVGGAALWSRRVLIWMLVLWAGKFLLDVNFPLSDMRVAILVQVGLVFTLFPLLVLRTFRLDPREALSLRMPRPQVWIAVLLGVPAGLLCTQGVFHLVQLVLPVPAEVLENFGQALAPENIPAWQILLLIALVPGIAEELTFRGVLLHGLRKRWGPVGVVLGVGLIFGVFHMAIFRILPTGFLGVVLTAVTLLTGSIFPAMAWHVLHNGLAVGLSLGGVDVDGAEAAGLMATFHGWAENPWFSAVGIPFLAFAFWILWRYRTPHGAETEAHAEAGPGPSA